MNRLRKLLLPLILISWVGVLYAAVFVNDTFTDADNVNIVDHTPDSGGVWTNGSVCFSQLPVSDHDDIYHLSDLNGCTVFNDQAPNSAEYNVQVDLVFHSGSVADYSLGVSGRAASAAETYYACAYNGFENEWTLYKAVAGTFTGLDGEAASISSGNTYTIRLEITDALKTCFVDEVEVASSADNAITAAGFAGLNSYRETNIGGMHFDNFSAFDIEAPVGGTKGKRLLLLGVGGK